VRGVPPCRPPMRHHCTTRCVHKRHRRKFKRLFKSVLRQYQGASATFVPMSFSAIYDLCKRCRFFRTHLVQFLTRYLRRSGSYQSQRPVLSIASIHAQSKEFFDTPSSRIAASRSSALVTNLGLIFLHKTKQPVAASTPLVIGSF
jgi:hypothetical protein